VLYSFSPDDGILPIADLYNVNGALYGTTEYGGAASGYAYGTVYKVTTSGTESVLYRFDDVSENDGATPYAGVIEVGSKLYGTTESGGGYGVGIIFAISLSGKETVLHAFGSGGPSGDGGGPVAGLVSLNGTLYGTTRSGGAHGRGTVFTVTPSGKYNVLYSFDWSSSNGDGFAPTSGLVNVGGKLYGTTLYGGFHHVGNVYSITPLGAETTVYSFGGGSGDGLSPYGGLTNVDGKLYGTTTYGGKHCNSSGIDCGTVFKVTTSGTETVLHSFGAGSDGNTPYLERLINVGGKLYGTTEDGGTYGHGTVFNITTSGKETVLYSFGAGSGDGAYPDAGLTEVNGALYGTTYRGGSDALGIVFSLTGFQ
jgi:uncharacterized repeat protein (TIGR03803 family)